MFRPMKVPAKGKFPLDMHNEEHAKGKGTQS